MLPRRRRMTDLYHDKHGGYFRRPSEDLSGSDANASFTALLLFIGFFVIFLIVVHIVRGLPLL